MVEFVSSVHGNRCPAAVASPAIVLRFGRRLPAIVLLLAVAMPVAQPAGQPAPSTAETGAANLLAGPAIPISRATGAITIDGDLSDAAWQNAQKVDTWYETRIGDSVLPPARSIGWVTYDDNYFYAAIEFEDPDPKKIRAPFGDRDNVDGSTDYGGVILDTDDDGKTGALFLVNPSGIQYDAVSNDVTGNEDSSPDFFWDSATKIHDHGWSLEIRIPFSSLRYPKTSPQNWGILFYRNYPRTEHYQMFSTKLPRGGNCFICYSNQLTGFTNLPSGGHFVIAPYVSATRESHASGALGSSLENDPIDGTGGLDAKWTLNADTVLDAAINPDFSQVESDTAQISTNQRFALFYPEKRPFFLEGVELLSTPIQAVYTRTIGAPQWGARATGKMGDTAYTALVSEDFGSSDQTLDLTIIPGPNNSDFALRDFKSRDFIGRMRHDIGRSFVSFLATDREIIGGGSNRVLGPDFQYRPNESDSLTGQVLFSQSHTPNRPDLAAEWNGQKLSGVSGTVQYSHNTETIDLFTQYNDYGTNFRADSGFVPQVGFRELYGEGGYTFRPTGFFSRIRTFLQLGRMQDRDGNLITRFVSPGFGSDGKWSSFLRLRLQFDRVRADRSPVDALGVDGREQTFPRRQFVYIYNFTPARWLANVELSGFIGDDVDYANGRLGKGGSVSLSGTVRPFNHLELSAIGDRRWLDVNSGGAPAGPQGNINPDEGPGGRLFTAEIARLRANYTFTSRAFLRVIGQYQKTSFEPDLWIFGRPPKSGEISTSALFSYKLNWQTVFFLGYGDRRLLRTYEGYENSERSLFFKLSYAFQH